MPSPPIFLSFRTEDAAMVARNLHDRLIDAFGEGTCFFDGVSIRGGSELSAAVREGVQGCQVLVAIIGAQWLEVLGDYGRKIDDPKDWVRQELSLAFERRKVVIPLLLDGAGARPPEESALPEELRVLSGLNALQWRARREFELDTETLLDTLRDATGLQRQDAARVHRVKELPNPRLLLSAIAQAILPVLRANDLDSLHGDRLRDLAEYVYSRWAQGRAPDELLAEVAAVARLRTSDLRALSERCARDVAEDHVEDVVAYLLRVRLAIRRHLRRPSDLLGTSTPEMTRIDGAETLGRYLPKGRQRFRAGDRPVPGSSLELVESLAIGGSCEVWHAHDPAVIRSDVALKIFDASSSAVRQASNEVAIHRHLCETLGDTPHGIIRLLRTHLEAEPPCLEYELLEGGDLVALVESWPVPERPSRALEVIRSLAHILAPLHRELGFVHRDLKPANVFLTKTGEPKLIDLGISAITIGEVEDAVAPATGGTPVYSSEEQVDGAAPHPSDDVYALGILWYQLAVGDTARRPPYGFRSRLKDVGLDGKKVDCVQACLADRGDRPSDADQLISLLVGPDKESVGRQESNVRASTPARVARKRETRPALSNAPTIRGFEHVEWFERGSHRVPIYAYQRWLQAIPTATPLDIDCQFALVSAGRSVPSFLVARTQVTQRVWGALRVEGLSSRPSHFVGERRPVERVNWYDARRWCRALELRLPTNSEWDRACCAGSSKTPHFPKPDGTELMRHAWFNRNSGGCTHEVGGKLASHFGLFDVEGNVWEWCEDDWIHDWIHDEELRTIRGGCWGSPPPEDYWRPGYLSRWHPEGRLRLIGFRPVMSYSLDSEHA